MRHTMKHDYDILVIGAGPAGLAFAKAVSGLGLSIAVVEKGAEAGLAAPKPDGRDIALTHASREALEKLGVWKHLPPAEIAPLKEARVLNGASSYFLQFAEARKPGEPLGCFVPNHIIRKAAYKTAKAAKDIHLLCGRTVKEVTAGKVTFAEGKPLHAQLVVAADSRFSETRRFSGISTRMLDFARVCIVARVTHDKPHEQVAYECFMGGMTLAVLPVRGKQSSIVLTLPAHEAEEVLQMQPADFGAYIAEAFQHRLGKMKLAGERHSYPLISVYANQFQAERLALVGDAAVGMHPITAHGFNFGLRGAWTLAGEVRRALELGLDIGSPEVLRRYERQHRKATLPLYMATNALVQLYTSESKPVRAVQDGLLRLGNRLSPVRNILMRRLTKPLHDLSVSRLAG